MNPVELITKRRDGRAHSLDELGFLAHGAATGSIPDYQLAAWLMAAYLNPLSPEETAWLTVAMAESGTRLDPSGLPTPRLDKHSTGGVGDKTTIVLLPLLAACGVTMLKMSGRGLGITGGTVDKLASIPGFRTDLTPKEMTSQAMRIGVALSGQTPDLAPADKALYGLRDVTATVGSLPLIVSSILSKKLAAGASHVLLDVKCGSGGFMPTLAEARALAGSLKETAKRVGLTIRLAITDMDQPLGRAAGNALEVKEAIRVLAGTETGRFRELCVRLAGEALHCVGACTSAKAGTSMAEQALSRGAAHEKAQAWVGAQGGDVRVFDSEAWSQGSRVLDVVHRGPEGYAARVDARRVGLAVLELGGGRQRKEDAIDPAVGVETLVEVGSELQPGQLVFRIHGSSQVDIDRALNLLEGAIEVSSECVSPRPVLMETL